MLVPDRRRALLAHLRRHGSAQVEVLAGKLGVSAWTVRRDLADLERQGLLTRAHGGALLVGPDPSFAPVLRASEGSGDADAENDATSAAKTRIGRLAAERLVDGSTVMLLAGSTTSALTSHLQHRRLTVVTNGLEIAYALRNAPDVELMMVGGLLHREQMTLLGPMTERAMADLHVDVIVAGAYGVHPEVGVTGAKILQAGYHHSMLRHSDALMVVAGAGKLGRRGPTVLARVDQVDAVITDDGADPTVVTGLRERGPEVVLA